jgi:hypothetical protein
MQKVQQSNNPWQLCTFAMSAVINAVIKLVNQRDHWSTLLPTGGCPPEGRSLRPSMPIGVMVVRLQSCMAVMDIF